MRTAKKFRCYSCKNSLGTHEPDLVLNDPTPYHLMIWHVEAKRGGAA